MPNRDDDAITPMADKLAQRTPTPPLSPVQPTSLPSSIREDSIFDAKSEEEEVLLVQEDGRIQMNKISASDGKRAASISGGESEEADDEGSRDSGGDERSGKETEEDVTMTPRTQRRRMEGGGGIAARRVHRTWKHFYEEVIKIYI